MKATAGPCGTGLPKALHCMSASFGSLSMLTFTVQKSIETCYCGYSLVTQHLASHTYATCAAACAQIHAVELTDVPTSLSCASAVALSASLFVPSCSSARRAASKSLPDRRDPRAEALAEGLARDFCGAREGARRAALAQGISWGCSFLGL